MFNIDQVKLFFEEINFKFVYDVRYREIDDAILIYVLNDDIGEKASDAYTSKHQMAILKNKISKIYNKSVELLYVQSENHQELEAGIFQILNRKFEDRISALYLSFIGNNTVNIWVDVEGENNLINDIVQQLDVVAKVADIKIKEINWADKFSDLPGLSSLLREIKVNQPLTLDLLYRSLREYYPALPERWVKNKLDLLRKKSFIHRNSDGTYAISTEGLAVVPAGKRKTSSDVERALAFGKKRW